MELQAAWALTHYLMHDREEQAGVGHGVNVQDA